MTAPDLNNLSARAVALFAEAYANAKATSEVDTSTNGVYPFFQVGTTSFSVDEDSDGSEEIDVWRVTVLVRHVVGLATEGYDGELETATRAQVQTVADYVRSRRWLQSASYTTRMDNLDYCLLTEGRAVSIANAAGDGSTAVGWEYTLIAQFTILNIQIYN